MILNELKAFTKNNDVYKLAANLKKIIKTAEQRVIIDYIMPFIPQKHQIKLKSLTHDVDELIKKQDSFNSSQNSISRSILYSYKPSKTKCDSSVQTETEKEFSKRYYC
jgi:hypothetical protein